MFGSLAGARLAWLSKNTRVWIPCQLPVKASFSFTRSGKPIRLSCTSKGSLAGRGKASDTGKETKRALHVSFSEISVHAYVIMYHNEKVYQVHILQKSFHVV